MIVGFIYIIKEKPTFVQEFAGCSPLTDDQKDFNQQLADAIEELRTNDEKIMDALESFTTDEGEAATGSVTTGSANNQLNDATQAADTAASN